MLISNQAESVIQRISMQILRTRPDQGGTGIFYHTPLRSFALVPIDGDWTRVDNNLAAAGLRSYQGRPFSEVPPGYRQEEVFTIIGTVPDEADPIKVVTVEGDVTTIMPGGLTCAFEILKSDLTALQEQNQMTLLLMANAVVQFNAQDYGTGTTEDGRQRDILRGSLWAVPQHFNIEVSRTEARSAAVSEEEIKQIAEWAKARGADRAANARAQSLADRGTRDKMRAEGDMPARRGTNTHVTTYQGPHLGVGNKTF